MGPDPRPNRHSPLVSGIKKFFSQIRTMPDFKNPLKDTRCFSDTSLVVGFAALLCATHLSLVDGFASALSTYALLIAVPLIWVSAKDWRCYEIPDAGVGLLLGMALLYLTLEAPSSIKSHALAALIIGTLIWGLGEVHFRLKRYEGIGIGDAKLFAAGAFLLGPLKLADLVLLSSLGGTAACLISLKSGGSPKRGIAFGPFIAYAIFILFHLDPMFL